MKRRILEEEVHNKTAVDGCVDAVTGAYDFFERCVMGDDDEGSGLVLRHSAAGLRKVVHSLTAADVGGLAVLAEYLVKDHLTLPAVHIPASEPHQKLSDLRLEYHYERDESHVQHSLHNVGHKPHIECGDNDPDDIQRQDGDEYAHSGSASDPAEYDIDQKGKEQYVKYVGQRKLEKTENRQYHIPLYISAQR